MISTIPEGFHIDIQAPHSIEELAKKYGVDRSTAYRWKRSIKSDVKESKPDQVVDITSQEQRTIYRLETEIQKLRTSLNDAKKHLSVDDDIRSLVYNIRGVDLPELEEDPVWLDSTSTLNTELVPVFCLSDTHIGAVVYPENINGINQYDVEIAERRINELVDDFIKIHKINLSNYSYPGCVLILGGDIIEQAMHGAEESNELTVSDQVIKSTSILVNVIQKLLSAFGKVAAFAVSGNHGRLIADKYVKTVNRFDNSLEKIVYHFVSSHFSGNSDFSMTTSSSDIVHFSINGLRHRLEHGDQIRFTGQAISGPLNSWERARLKRSGVDSAVNKPFDVLIFGHFHTHAVMAKMIAMDSTKGYDAYANSMALPYSLPGATIYCVNRHGEICFATNLKCRDNDPSKTISGPFVSIF